MAGVVVGFMVGFMVVVALADVTDTAMDSAIERLTHNANDRREKQNRVLFMRAFSANWNRLMMHYVVWVACETVARLT